MILNFYQDFGEVLKAQLADYRKAATSSTHPALPDAEFWKSNGDELLYSFEVTDPHQLVNALILWKRAVLDYRTRLERSTDLDVKATAWAAGFPLMNTEVIFEEALSGGKPQGSSALARQTDLRRKWHKGGNNRKGLTLDFIGPSIDTGFRLSQLSTAEQMAISLDLAYCIAKHAEPASKSELKIYYGGSRQLKGVLGGRPYPAFWVFVGSESATKLQEAEDQFGGPVKHVKESDLVDFCQHFYTEHSNYLIKPFIERDGKVVFGDKSEEYQKAVDRLQETAGDDKKVVEGIEKAAKATGAGATPTTVELSQFIRESIRQMAIRSSQTQAPQQEPENAKPSGDEGESQ